MPVNHDSHTSGSETANWYLVQCKPRQGFYAATHFQNQSFRVFHPTQAVERSHANRKWVQSESLFPHYLFIQLTPEQSFATVNSTRGVINVVGFQGGPTVVAPCIVTALMRLCRIQDDQESPPGLKREPEKAVRVPRECSQAVKSIVNTAEGEERVIKLMSLILQLQEQDAPAKTRKSVNPK